MKVKEIFELALKMGKDADPRDNKVVEDQLKRLQKGFDKLSDKKKNLHPKEQLKNPYPDSSIHNVDSGKEVKKVFAAIDVTEGTMLLAKELGADLVLTHHPIGKSLALLGEVMGLQVNVYGRYGIPVNVIEGLTKKKTKEVKRGVHAVNHYLAVDAAKLANVNLINVHTPTDNLIYDFFHKLVKEKKPEYVKDVLKMLLEIPEYQEAARRGSRPCLFAGSPGNYCGKVIPTEITGGTNGAEKIYSYLTNAGIGTVISMHQSEKHRKEAEKAFVNVVIASHIASDSLGMNLFIDELEKKGIEIIPGGGFIRVSRVKDKKGELINPIS